MRKSWFPILLVAAVVLALAMNPSAEQHRSAIKAAMAARSPLAGALGIGSLRAFVSTYHSLGVASYTVVNEHVASVGAYGYVHVFH